LVDLLELYIILFIMRNILLMYGDQFYYGFQLLIDSQNIQGWEYKFQKE